MNKNKQEEKGLTMMGLIFYTSVAIIGAVLAIYVVLLDAEIVVL